MSRHPVNRQTHDARSFGERTADAFTQAFGTWRYIIIQTLIILLWMTLNVVALVHHWDAYPFILLNLGFSAQASYAAPLILMAQNRSAAVDRLTLEHDAQLNETELQILEELRTLTREVHAWQRSSPASRTTPTTASTTSRKARSATTRSTAHEG